MYSMPNGEQVQEGAGSDEESGGHQYAEDSEKDSDTDSGDSNSKRRLTRRPVLSVVPSNRMIPWASKVKEFC